MNPDYQHRLEAEIDRELKALPELHAPSSLAPRVLAAIHAQREARWYCRPWPAWPVSLRLASLSLALLLLGGACFAAVRLCQSQPVSAAAATAGRWFAAVSALGRGFNATTGSLAGIVQNLNPGILLGCAFALLLAYGTFLVLATCCYRLVLAAANHKSYETTET